MDASGYRVRRHWFERGPRYAKFVHSGCARDIGIALFLTALGSSDAAHSDLVFR
ncbi:hypothetical protein SAMN03159496_05945 [Rhizobium sp. NFR07]|nr:hypothetical protein SAMN03159496_05945 [Rhizobium sp. NFR07]